MWCVLCDLYRGQILVPAGDSPFIMPAAPPPRFPFAEAAAIARARRERRGVRKQERKRRNYHAAQGRLVCGVEDEEIGLWPFVERARGGGGGGGGGEGLSVTLTPLRDVLEVEAIVGGKKRRRCS